MKTARWMCIQSFVVACCLSLTADVVARNKGNSCEPHALLKEELRKTHILHEDDEKFDREAIAQQAKAHWERNPSDPAAIYLHARSLVGRNTKEAIAKLNALAAEAPDFPWTYLELGHIHIHPAFRDPAKSIENLKKWAAKCPGALESVRLLENSGDTDLMRDALRRLRKRLESSAQPEDSLYYGNAWSLEFRLAPVTEHAQVRQRVAEEVRQLREKNLNNKEWLLALHAGYGLIGDATGNRWAEDEMLRLFPKWSYTRHLIRLRWQNEHPRPRYDEYEKKKAFDRAMVKATGEWLKMWPDDLSIWDWRFAALCDLKDEIGDAQMEAAAESVLKAVEKDELYGFANTPIQITIAREFSRRKIATERIPGLVTRGLAVMEIITRQDVASDLFLPSHPDALVGQRLLEHTRLRIWPLLAEAYLRLKQPEQARGTLAQMADALGIGKQEMPRRENYDLVRYWQAVATLAEAESRKQDAMTAYTNALSHRPKSDTIGAGQKDELFENAQRLWKELGGSEDSWQAYAARHDLSASQPYIPRKPYWTPKATALSDFALTDLSGRKWKLADLKGKVVFVYFWAVWETLAPRQLPYVQKLHQQMQGDEDVMVLTFNFDTELGVVEPFMKEKQYDFPVVLARTFVERHQLFGGSRNWVIDRDGVLQYEWSGYEAPAEEWMKSVLETIQKVKEKQ